MEIKYGSVKKSKRNLNNWENVKKDNKLFLLKLDICIWRDLVVSDFWDYSSGLQLEPFFSFSSSINIS